MTRPASRPSSLDPEVLGPVPSGFFVGSVEGLPPSGWTSLSGTLTPCGFSWSAQATRRRPRARTRRRAISGLVTA